jgi:hypothetical protein
MVLALGVSFEIGGVEVDLSKITRAVPFCFVIEVARGWVATFSARGDGLCADFVAKLDDRDEAVSAGAIPLLCSGVGTGSKGGEGAPQR